MQFPPFPLTENGLDEDKSQNISFVKSLPALQIINQPHATYPPSPASFSG